MNKPIKRHSALQPLSRDHHQGLLLCWKIRKGISKNISANEIASYTQWFFKEHLMLHFKIEEEQIFPILGNENKFVQQALSEHTLIASLIESIKNDYPHLEKIADTIEAHIRFEERELFNMIQLNASEAQLQSLHLIENETIFCENSNYNFWN